MLKFHTDPASDSNIWDEMGFPVAYVADEVENKRAARDLLAASPDLLAALVELLDQLEGIGIADWHGAEGLDITQARAAIAKAEGGAS